MAKPKISLKMQIYLLMGMIILVASIQQFLFYKTLPQNERTVRVSVKVPLRSNVDKIQLSGIKDLYFSNSDRLSKVKTISFNSDNTVTVILEDKGTKSEERSLFAGQYVSLNQRVYLHGLLEAEGVVTKIDE